MLQENTLDDRISLHLYAPPVVEAFCKKKTPENLMKVLFALVAPNDYRVVAEGLSAGLESGISSANWEARNDRWACHMFGPGLHGLVHLEVSFPKVKDLLRKDAMIYPGFFRMVAFRSASGISAGCADTNPPFIAQKFDFGRIPANDIHGPQDLLKLCTTFRDFSDPESCLQAGFQPTRSRLPAGFQSFLAGFLLDMIGTILGKIVVGSRKIEIVNEPFAYGSGDSRYSFWAATPALAKLLRCGDSKPRFLVSVEEPALLDTWQAWIKEENHILEANR